MEEESLKSGSHKRPLERRKGKAELSVESARKETSRRAKTALDPEISMVLEQKTTLKFLVRQYLLQILEKSDLESLDRICDAIFANLAASKLFDKTGRAMEPINWFPEGSTVEIKKGRLYIKGPDGKMFVSGVALDVEKAKSVVDTEDMTRSDFPTVAHIRLDASNSEQLIGRSSLRGDLPITMDDQEDAERVLGELRGSGNYGEIASIRTDNGSSRALRHMARAILDEDVDIINGIFALRVTAMYGNDKNARIRAVNKLRTIGEQDENERGSVRRELKNIIEGEGPDQYRDEDITKLAQGALQALSNI